MTRNDPNRLLFISLALAVAATPAGAGGPLAVASPGQAYVWPDGGVGITFNPDQGVLGPLSNADAVALTADSFQRWEDVATATATYVAGTALPVDVDDSNFGPWLNPVAPDGLSAVVYDADGQIFDLLFGADSGILGFAGPEWLNTLDGTITEGSSFINGGAIENTPESLQQAFGTLVHEFGHWSNLAHTQVNGVLYIEEFIGAPPGTFDNTGPNPFDLFPRVSLIGNVETMYPFLVPGDGTENLKADDIAIFSFLYPEPDFLTTTGAISGTILGPNGSTPITGVNVIARNVDDPFGDAVSALSSDFTDDFTPGAPVVGTYTLRGLTPGASYAVYVDEIFDGGFSTPPLQPLPGPEEAYNGVNESSDPVTDVPSEYEAVVAAAGMATTGIDIIFAKREPGPIDLTDDGSAQLFLPFEFDFCGVKHDSVFVNANGNLTFGAASDSFSPAPREHLAGPPRIAPLWSDLSPNVAGEVAFDETDHSLIVTWTDVPDWPGVGGNTFSVELMNRRSHHHGDGIRFTYEDMTSELALTGYSCGGRVTSGFEIESDVSRHWWINKINFLRRAAVYEWFNAADVDLQGRRIEMRSPRGFRDRREPNNTIADATRVRLPYNTASSLYRYSSIDGTDVDFYRFKVKAGQTLLVETAPGPESDTMVAIFDTDGNQLALDDDAFEVGGPSQLLVLSQFDAEFVVGVTTWPDFGFTGNGADFGRYTLNIQAFDGEVVTSGVFGDLFLLDDEDYKEIPFEGFSFPYQGRRWKSVFVSSNGNLTFGEPPSDPLGGVFDFDPNVPELLDGPPRIAPLWRDLSPFNPFLGTPAGIVLFESTNKALTVHYVGMPEFFYGGTNTYSVTLDRWGRIKFKYGATNRSGGIAGITQGGGASDPGSTNLSRRFFLRKRGTTYEEFFGTFPTFGGDDLGFRHFRFR